MEISNPRRILALGPPDSGVLQVLKDLTGTSPPPPSASTSSTAGLSHQWHLRTKYYTAPLSIWIDEHTSPHAWKAEFLAPEAAEVISAVGAWIYVFRKPATGAEADFVREGLKAVAEVVKNAAPEWDGVMVAVATKAWEVGSEGFAVEVWDEWAAQHGWEVVDAEQGGGRDALGERRGVERLREALEANDWEGEEGLDGLGIEDEVDAAVGDGDGAESSLPDMDSLAIADEDFGGELEGLRKALEGSEGTKGLLGPEGESDGVEQLEDMMKKVLAIKEMGEGMEDAERRRFASRAVRDLVKDL